LGKEHRPGLGSVDGILSRDAFAASQRNRYSMGLAFVLPPYTRYATHDAMHVTDDQPTGSNALFLNPTGARSRRHLAQFVSAIDVFAGVATRL